MFLEIFYSTCSLHFIVISRIEWYTLMQFMASGKVKVGIIGTGNIGSDLLSKIQKSKYLTCGIFTGINPASKNIHRAKKMGINTASNSLQAIIDNPNSCEIVFDATSARVHFHNAPILKKLKKFTIDMTPSRVGKMCIPLLNLSSSLREENINMISCGAQAVTPIVAAIKKIHPDMEYVELVSSISSQSAGLGTRNNIDEYTQATSDAIKKLANIKNVKTIIILNPSDPPAVMHNTLYLEIKNPNLKKISQEIIRVEKEFKKFVPGYSMVIEPMYRDNVLILMNKVVGQGDFLPSYAGNLDIINATAIKVAEEYAKKIIKK